MAVEPGALSQVVDRHRRSVRVPAVDAQGAKRRREILRAVVDGVGIRGSRQRSRKRPAAADRLVVDARSDRAALARDPGFAVIVGRGGLVACRQQKEHSGDRASRLMVGEQNRIGVFDRCRRRFVLPQSLREGAANLVGKRHAQRLDVGLEEDFAGIPVDADRGLAGVQTQTASSRRRVALIPRDAGSGRRVGNRRRRRRHGCDGRQSHRSRVDVAARSRLDVEGNDSNRVGRVGTRHRRKGHDFRVCGGRRLPDDHTARIQNRQVEIRVRARPLRLDRDDVRGAVVRWYRHRQGVVVAGSRAGRTDGRHAAHLIQLIVVGKRPARIRRGRTGRGHRSRRWSGCGGGEAERCGQNHTDQQARPECS